MTRLRGWLLTSLVLAVFAFGLPWLTHFADGGLSLMLPLLWLATVVAGIVRLGRRGLWLLAGAPLVLYWPALIVIWAQDAYFGF